MLEFDDLLDLEFNLILKEFTGLCPIELEMKEFSIL